MKVRVLYFGQLRELAGKREEQVEIEEGATVQRLFDQIAIEFTELRNFDDVIAIGVNQAFARRNQVLRDSDEVAMLPPVSGGAPTAVNDEPFVRIQRERIVPHDIVPKYERPEDGAIVIFDGIVRNHSRNRQTKYLEYEAYEEMALKQMRELVEQARKEFAIRNVALVHRLGKLEIGESSVLIAVYSAHRAAAFDACRWIIDTLKKTVPIWKKEFFVDGAVWADGEPFPEDAIAPRAH
jgi:molybdopterin synthase catalytic subunit